MFNISSGIQPTAKKIVVYGVEGIGKSTLVSQFPDPLFIDTEGSTNYMDVKRLPKPSSWQYLKDEVDFVKNNRPCKTLVIDTFDWAEMLEIQDLCAKNNVNGIESFGYGKGYIYSAEEIGKFLNQLSDVVDCGINVVLTAHATIRKFEQPDEMGAYDKYELKLGAKTGSRTAALVKEWADMVLFLNYKTFAVQIDKDGKKHKAQGGQRVMYATHHPCWDAKSRFNLPDEMPLAFSAISHIFNDEKDIAFAETLPFDSSELTKEDVETVNDIPVNGPQPLDDLKPIGVPDALWDLMKTSNITTEQIRKAVGTKGYYPESTPISNYDQGFINGVLIGAWDQIKQFIQGGYK